MSSRLLDKRDTSPKSQDELTNSILEELGFFNEYVNDSFDEYLNNNYFQFK